MRALLFIVATLLVTAVSSEASAGVKRYAIIIGNNAPPSDEPSLASLRYADDDAARYYELTKSWGAESIVLTVLDHVTQRRFPMLPMVSRPPTRTNLDDAINAIALQVERDRETLLIAKTTEAAFPGLQARILELHPYELPEIIAVPVTQGLPEYLNWINKCTDSETSAHSG